MNFKVLVQFKFILKECTKMYFQQLHRTESNTSTFCVDIKHTTDIDFAGYSNAI